MKPEASKWVEFYRKSCVEYYQQLTTRLGGLPDDYPSIIFELNAEIFPEYCASVCHGEAFEKVKKKPNHIVFKLAAALLKSYAKLVVIRVIGLIAAVVNKRPSLARAGEYTRFMVTYVDGRSGRLDQKDFNRSEGSVFAEGAWMILGVRLPSIRWFEYFKGEREDVICVERLFSFRHIFAFYVATWRIWRKLKHGGLSGSRVEAAFFEDATSGHALFAWQYSLVVSGLMRIHPAGGNTIVAFPMEQQDWMMLTAYRLKLSQGCRLWGVQNGLRPVGNPNLYNFDSAPIYRRAQFDRLYYISPSWKGYWQAIGHRCEMEGMEKHRFSLAPIPICIDRSLKRALYICGVSVLKFEEDVRVLKALGPEWEICVKLHPTMPHSPLQELITPVSDISALPYSFIVYSNTAMIFQLHVEKDRAFGFNFPGQLMLNPVLSIDEWPDTTIYMPSKTDVSKNSTFLKSKIEHSKVISHVA